MRANGENFLAPTPFDQNFYTAAGYYGNVVYSYAMSGTQAEWETYGSVGNITDMETPAVDDEFVYYYSGDLDILDRASGAIVQTIPDPFFNWNGYSYYGSPIIADDDTILAYSGSTGPEGQFEPRYRTHRPLVSFSSMTGRYNWR